MIRYKKWITGKPGMDLFGQWKERQLYFEFIIDYAKM
jgi:hypothetical protein